MVTKGYEVDKKVTYKKIGGTKKKTKKRATKKRVAYSKKNNPVHAVRFGSHKAATKKPVDGPNEALHRALIMAPFHARQMMGPNYQLARLCSDGQFGPTRLIEMRSTIEVTLPASGNLNIAVNPSLLYAATAYDDSGSGVNTVFDKWDGSGQTNFRSMQGILSQVSGVSLGRCLAMGASLVSTQNVTQASGQIGCVQAVSDPTGQRGASGAGVKIYTMQDLANMNGAYVGKGVEGVHCYWVPEDSCAGYGVNTIPDTGGTPATNSYYVPVEWRYSDFMGVGWTIGGLRASNVDSGNAAVDYADPMGIPYGGVSKLNLAPKLFFRVEGATTNSPVYKLEVVQHWEVIDYQRGHDLAPGQAGIHPSGHRGIIGTITHDVSAAVHEVENVAGSALHFAGKAVSIGEEVVGGVETVAKYASLLAAL